MRVTRTRRYVGEPGNKEMLWIFSGEISRKNGSREALTTTRIRSKAKFWVGLKKTRRLTGNGCDGGSVSR